MVRGNRFSENLGLPAKLLTKVIRRKNRIYFAFLSQLTYKLCLLAK
jgi:hypothetical protein